MAVPLEKFVKQLEDSGIVLGETLKDFLPPTSEPKDAEELARDLIRKRKLTKFQAEEISRGKGKSLVLGNYVLLEKIGAGGMGQVFKAEHRRMHRIVAIKVLPPNLTKNAAAIARFEREATAAAKISHPNIVAAHDADCANGVHFLVMELVEGSDLSALVKKNGPLSVEKAVNYVLQAARGLEAAHKKGIVHRDIKPANLLLDNEGIVKILDMGLARLSGDGDAPTAAELTSSGQIMGTVDYMAPEQAVDTKTADARADIYALGCSLFYLLTGTATYEGDTIMQKLLAHRERPIPSLRPVRAEVSEPLEIVFKTMLAKKVEDRYQTMTEVVAALESCGRFKEETLHDEWSADVSNDPAQTALLEAASLPPTIAAQTEKASNPPTDKGKKKRLLIGVAVLGVAILAGLVVQLTTKDGTLIVTMNEPDAEVQVLTEDGTVEITKKGKKGTISISVDPGKHRLKVTKDGFSVFGQDFEIEAGGKQPITAKLVPLEEQAVVATAGWHGWTADAPKPAISPFDAGQAKKHQEAWAAYLKIPVEYTNSIGMTFRLIPPGEFTMGSTPEEIGEAIRLAGEDKHWQECIRTETPQHKAILTQPIYFSTHEVTQAQYEQLMGKNPSHFAPAGAGKDAIAGMDTASHPVENVSWNDAADFCAKLCEREKHRPFYSRGGETVTMQEGDGYRLPTEAEWEFSCRAGSITNYWIGDKNENFAQAGWSTENSVGRTHAVGQLKSNPFGIYDMHGNVWEWVEDEWSPSYYYQFQEKSALDPSGPPWAGSQRVLRGGDWNVAVSGCRSSFRYVAPVPRSNGIGFRTALRVDAVRQSGLDGVKKPLAFQKPGFDQWMKDVAALSAEQQVEAVAKKLMALNPGFDGRVTDWDGKGTPKIENGVVTAIGIVTDNVTDISPIRVLVGLTRLDCPGGGHLTGKLSDLSPLHGLPLTALGILNTQVSDLSPLTKMPLAHLHCGNTPVSDLSPLEGSRLTTLICDATGVTDLSPLRGIKLTALSCALTNVSDLSPLQGMPLTILRCAHTKVSNLSPMEGMHLGHLDIYNTQVSDLSPLQGMNLTEARITPNNITGGLDVIRKMESLKALGIDSNNQWPPDEFWKK